MEGEDRRSMRLALRSWLDNGEWEQRANWLAEHVIRKALTGQIAYMRLFFRMHDGDARQTAETEMSFEAGSGPIVAAVAPSPENVKAA